MAKIINDSLITSKPNAPLDVRTEVATLADVVNISNPSESLVFKVLETGKYYKVDSLKTVKIEGSALTKKVVESFSSVGDVEDAPKDGGKYYRQNGVWVKVDESIDPALPILMINLKSDRGSDDTIERLKFTVKYASVVTELGSGQRINVPYGARLVVEFPSVEGYNKPDDIVVEDVSGNVVRNVVYEYNVTEVNVYVSSEDGTPVDGQVVSVEEYSLFESIPNGAYIESVDGVLYDNNSWDAKKTANSVVVVTDKQKVRIALSMEYTGDSDALTSGKTGTDVLSDAILDFNGEEHTNDSSQRVKYWEYAKEYSFANGMSGAYIPALGELNNIKDYWADILKCFVVLGVEIESSSLASSTSSSNYSSTYVGYTTWCINMATGEMKIGTTRHAIIYFKTIDAIERLKDVRKNNYEVLGGKANFNAIKGNEVVVTINKKEGDYGTPESVTFVADGTTKNISMMYVKLLIDTIYINNLIADTKSIVSGDVNGKAVQAIWANTKRYLGKIIAKDDGDNELVLHDIDQNDNRYYPDGVAIDLEGLGTSAYFFTKIPSMSYRITQMSDNVFKVQICYKNKPEGDGWKYFKELILPTFCHTTGSGFFPEYKDTMLTDQVATNSMIDGMRGLDIVDYSNFMLLLYAKYGALNIGEGAEDLTPDPSFMESNTIKTGFSLAGGTKDAIYKFEGTQPAYNMLGLELLFRPLLRYMTFASGNRKDGMTNNLSVSGNKLKVVCRDISFNLSISTGYVRSLYLGEYFLFIPSSIGGSSDTYYRLNCTSLSNPKFVIGGEQFTTTTGTEGTCDRVVIDCDYRIEEDFVKFNELENVWK